MKIKNVVFLLFFFTTQSVLADITCDTDVSGYYAVYEPNSYTCSSGQYLPANTLGCVSCPNGWTCPGGTFDFNENEFQGASGTITTNTMNNICAVNFPSDLRAVYEPNSHNCSAGYYLPANIDECTVCPAHTVCSGGTYTFNETTTQGITGCESGYNLQNNVCVGNIITINWSDADALDISANNAGTMTYGGDIRTPRTAIDKTNIGLRFKGWKFTPNQ